MFKSILDDITPYEAGKPIELVVREFGIKAEDIIKLGSNENPFGTSKQVIETLQNQAHLAWAYPDDLAFDLKHKLAAHYGISPKELIVGAGSDQIIEFCMNSLDSRNACVITAKTTFAMYGLYSNLSGFEIHKTQSDEHNLTEFLNLYQQLKAQNKRVGAIFICAPNNPLGECLDTKAIREFVAQIDNQTLVIIDGAYQEFASYKDINKAINPASFIKEFRNVVYLGTFSKAYGLGGMRVGYGIASKDIIATLYKVRPPFNVTTLSLKAACVALDDDKFMRHCVKQNFIQMAQYEAFANEMGLTFIPSFANFITMFPSDFSASVLCDWLLRRGVIIRNLASYGLNAIRITIGTKAQNERVLAFLREFITYHK